MTPAQVKYMCLLLYTCLCLHAKYRPKNVQRQVSEHQIRPNNKLSLLNPYKVVSKTLDT